MNRLFKISLLIVLCFQYGCRSFTFSKSGRIELKNLTYYFNDSMKVGAVFFHDTPLTIGDSVLNKLQRFDKEMLKKFNVVKSDTVLFSSRPKTAFWKAIGLVRNQGNLRLSDYKLTRDGKDLYLVKTIKNKNSEAYEGLIRIDQKRFLSIIFYMHPDYHMSYTDISGFNSIMSWTSRRIESGESMTPVLNVFEDVEELFEDHGYLAPFMLEKNRSSYKDENNFVDQALATYYSFCGDSDLAKQASRSFAGFKKETMEPGSLSPAAAAILRQTADKQVVMFNTAHHLPEHAYFVGQLLDSLYKQGFTDFALEGLSDSSSVMNYRFVTFEDGFYTRDPVLSNIIGKAVAIGFNVIGYDVASENREPDQAQNIVNQTIKVNKDCRLLVLAGYGHIDEASAPKKMAVFFREMTGINPFTIDQTTLMTSSCKNLEERSKDEVFVHSNKDLRTGFDMVVWNNIDMENKPIHFPFAGVPKDISIDLPDMATERDSLAAFLIYNQVNFLRDSTVTPIFVKVIPAKKNTYQIKLEKGSYSVRCLGEDKRLLYKRELIVN